MSKRLYRPTKIGLIVIFLLTGFIIFSHSAMGQRLNLSPDLVVAIQNFLASDMQIKACDYKDGMILLVKPVATGQAGDSGRYEAGDIIEIRDGTKLCENFGDKSPLSKKELTHLLPLYYPAKLTEEEIREMTEPEMNYESGIMNYAEDPDQQAEILKMRKKGIDYTAILDQSEITKKANLKNINRIPTIDLDIIKEKTEEQKAVVSINDYTPPEKTTWQKFVDIMRPTAHALTNPVVVVDTGGTGDYTSLNAAIAAEQAVLTTTDEQITFKCQSTNGNEDTAQVVVDGYTTDATRYIKIWTDPSESYRHTGKWGDTKYRINYSLTASGQYAFQVKENYTQVIGLQITMTKGIYYGHGVALSYPANSILFDSNIVKGNGYNYYNGIVGADYGKSIISNNISYGWLGGGTNGYGFTPGADNSSYYNYLYNNTSFANGRGFYVAANRYSVLTNNIAMGNLDIDYSAYTFGAASDYNASSDTSAPGTTTAKSKTSYSDYFVDYTNKDFHLKGNTSSLLSLGGNSLSGIFTNDIDGDTRSAWDVGADEYVASGGGETATSSVKVRGGGNASAPSVKFRGGVGFNTTLSGAPVAGFACGDTIVGQDGLTYGTVLALDGECWLDRNLGATQVATSKTDALAYGDLYQWGRLYDGHQATTSGTTATNATTDVPGHGSFITEGSSPYDWRVPQNNNLWQGVSGTNNPCPSGFRLPTSAEWTALATAEGITNGTSDDKAFASSLKLPLAGYRNYSSGSVLYRGSYGYYWSSTVDSTYARRLYFNSSSVNPSNISYRAYGFSVRCLKD